jgi:hypothetical protein
MFSTTRSAPATSAAAIAPSCHYATTHFLFVAFNFFNDFYCHVGCSHAQPAVRTLCLRPFNLTHKKKNRRRRDLNSG